MPAAKSKPKTPAKLHSFSKQIVTIGKHFVNGKQREVTEDQVRRWIANHDAMQAKGKRLPAPFKHRKDAVPMASTAKPKGGDGFSLGDSSANSGYWKRLWVDDAIDPKTEEKLIDPSTGKPVKALHGEIRCPGDPNDLNTPAGKVGQTVEECSVYAMSNFTDGKGQKYDDALLHIAVVVNPVEDNQPNFVPMGEVDDDALILSMSTAIPFKKGKADDDSDSDDDGESDDQDDDDGMDADDDGLDDDSDLPAPEPQEQVNDLEPLIQMLKQHEGPIHLPPDTTVKNLASRLWLLVNHTSQTAAANKQQPDLNAGTINQPPGGTQPKSRNPFAMSIKDPKVLKTFEKQFGTRQTAVKERIKTLATDGVIDKEIADEMNGEVDSFAMSVVEVDGAYELSPIPVEKTISILEKSSGRLQNDEFGMSHDNERPRPLSRPDERQGDKKLTPEQVKEHVAGFTSTVRR